MTAKALVEITFDGDETWKASGNGMVLDEGKLVPMGNEKLTPFYNSDERRRIDPADEPELYMQTRLKFDANAYGRYVETDIEIEESAA